LKILVSAQSFVFGPASKLITICRLLKRPNDKIHIDFVGQGIAKTYVEPNKE